MGVPKWFNTISVKAGSTYTTKDGVIVVTRSYSSKVPDAGKKLLVDYTIDGEAKEPIGQYQFKKMIFELIGEPSEDPPAPQDPPPQDPPQPPPPQDPPSPPSPPQDPPPVERGWLDWMDDVYDFLFGKK